MCNLSAGYLFKKITVSLIALSGIIALANALPAHAKTVMANLLPNGPGRPFTWAAYPTTEIGIADARLGTEITPTGSLFTGYGELILEIGANAHRVCAPIRTLAHGFLPVIHYHFYDHSVRYGVTLFSWALSPREPDRHPINFIRIKAFNFANTSATSHLTVAFRYGGGKHCFPRPSITAVPGKYFQPGVHFNPHWTYGFHSGLAIRSGKVVFTFPTETNPQLLLAHGKAYSHPQKLAITALTPALMVRYAVHLKAGQQMELNFKMPVQPIATTNPVALRRLRQLTLSKALGDCRTWWRRQIRAKGLQLYLPEKKVVNTFRASEMYLMLARDRWPAKRPGGRSIYVQTVNKLQYHAFWLRDGSYMIRAYDLTGHANRAAQCLNFILDQQKPNGNFISQPGEHDGWGEALWAIGQHYQLTGNLHFARRVFPHIQRAVTWLAKARRRDPLHLIPGGKPFDDEFPNGTWAHITGDNFYALDGLHEAILLADALGHTATATAWRQEYRDYHHVLFQRLRKIGRSDGDYMPPGLGVEGGHDWGNMLALYPHELLLPNDPLVTGTLQHTLREYAEGLMTYGVQLHDYLGMNNTETWIIRGQQRSVLRDLYAILVHTSATQAGWECGPPAWSTRNYGGDLAPHGWFAADYIAVVRNMLIRGQHNTLQLLSVLSPKWTQPGDILSLQNAPTRFGPLNLWSVFTANGMVLHIHADFRKPPAQICLHIPWYVSPIGATADGHAVKISGRSLILPVNVRRVYMYWQRAGNLRNWSYCAFVKRFEHAWRSRYFRGAALSFGNGPDAWPK